MIWAQWTLLIAMCFFAVILAIKCAVDPKGTEFVAFLIWVGMAIIAFLASAFSHIIGVPG